MLIATRFEILRNVQTGLRPTLMAEKPRRVATMLCEESFNRLGFAMMHHKTVFFEDQTHDWDWREGKFYYYTRIAMQADVLLAYEVQDVSKFDVEDWVLAFKENHALHHARKPALRLLLRQIFEFAIARASEVSDARARVEAVKTFLANLSVQSAQTLKASDWKLEVYRWIAWHNGFPHLAAWQSQNRKG